MLAYALRKSWGIAIILNPDSADTQVLPNVSRDDHRPFRVVALGSPCRDRAVPLVGNRGLVRGQAAAHGRRGFKCQVPVTVLVRF
jgi:hypothetical protein